MNELALKKRAVAEAHRQLVFDSIAQVMERVFLSRASGILTDQEWQDVEATAVLACYFVWCRETGALEDEGRQRRIMARATEIATRLTGAIETERIP